VFYSFDKLVKSVAGLSFEIWLTIADGSNLAKFSFFEPIH
jgi:hypothetical protein